MALPFVNNDGGRHGNSQVQRLMSYGLLRAAFRPGADVCVIRAVARHREVLLTQQAS